eukprot:214273-Hanusia_phi.AAC.2
MFSSSISSSIFSLSPSHHPFGFAPNKLRQILLLLRSPCSLFSYAPDPLVQISELSHSTEELNKKVKMIKPLVDVC